MAITNETSSKDNFKTLLNLWGLSTDSKPVTKFGSLQIANASVFNEFDTGYTYRYDAAGKKWIKQVIQGGGGGGTGGDGNANIEAGTTASWDTRTSYIPSTNTIIIYTDYKTVDGINIPGIKIADGSAYVVDLPFATDWLEALITSHINDSSIHVTAEERSKIDNAVSVDDTSVVDGNLVLG